VHVAHCTTSNSDFTWKLLFATDGPLFVFEYPYNVTLGRLLCP
jgi:hypothetical protein